MLREIRNVFRLEKENKAIKDTILRYIRNIFENEVQENCHKPVTISNVWSNNYIEYESNVIEMKHYQLKSILIKLDHI